MELNSVKEYLSRANYSELRICSKLSQLEKMHRIMLEMGGSDRTEAKIAALQEEVDREIDELIEVKTEILRLIRRLPKPEHQTVLELRYLKGWTWKKIMINMHYSRSWTFTLHQSALEQIRYLLNERTETDRNGLPSAL